MITRKTVLEFVSVNVTRGAFGTAATKTTAKSAIASDGSNPHESSFE